MPVFVAGLRMSMLFLNVYETFKTLKQPDPSKRSGQPSARALTQRKRNMKGCLAVWIIWCCFAMYERTFDNIVSVLVPFYDELKSLVLLFLLLTRARGAEPIYLHVLRPLIKPYTTTLDSLLDLTTMVGEILFLFFSFPIQLAVSWWMRVSLFHNAGPRLDTPDPEPRAEPPDSPSAGSTTLPENPPELEPRLRVSDTDKHLNENDIPSIRNPRGAGKVHHIYPELGKVSLRTRHHARGPQRQTQTQPIHSHSSIIEMGQSHGHPPSTKSQTRQPPRRLASDPHPTPSMPEIWYPPPSAYDSEAIFRPSRTGGGGGTASSDPNASSTVASSRAQEQVDEWRLYPPFPSAYPVTPLPATSKLPSTPRRHSDPAHVSAVPEEQEQDFGRSVLRLDSNESLSDDHMSDVQDTTLVPSDIDGDGDGDSGGMEQEEDDDFDISLQTPRPTRRGRRTRSTATKSSVPMTDQRPPMGNNRTASGSSSSLSISDSSSAPGRKRTLPRTAVEVHSRTGAKKMSTRRALRSAHLPPMREEDASTTNSDDGEESSNVTDSAEESRRVEPGLKRRRVIDLPDETVLPATASGPARKNTTATKRTTASTKAPSRTSSRLSGTRSSSRRNAPGVTVPPDEASGGKVPAPPRNTRSQK